MVYEQIQYNFRAYLIPRIADYTTSAGFVLKFIKLDSTNRQSINKVSNLIAAIKEVNISPNTTKPGDV